jgi:hypothetical protein
MNENDVPDWLLKAAQQASDMVRPYLPIVRAAQQYVEEARAAQAAAGPSLLSGREVALAMDAGMREFLAAIRQQWDVLIRVPTLTVGVSFPPVSVVVSDAGAASDTLTVAVRDSRTGKVVQISAMTIFLAILWVLTIALPPVVVLLLPVEVQSIIAGYVAAIGLTLIIHWRISDSRKRDD